MNEILRVEELSKTFRKKGFFHSDSNSVKAVNNVSFSLAKGEVFEKIRSMESSFVPGSIDALANTRELEGSLLEASHISPNELKPGMRLLEELVLSDGKLLAPVGAIVNSSYPQSIQSHWAALGESFFPNQIEVLA